MPSREPMSVAEAEDEAARAQTRARAARARAIRLRQLAEVEPSEPLASSARSRRRWLAGAATVLICVSVLASGLMLWQHHTMVQKRQRAAEFAAAARKGVVTLMSIDANHAKDDFQRIIDDCTGQLKAQLQVTAQGLVDALGRSKISTNATVQAVAVESMTDDSGVVLVAAKSDTTTTDNTKRPPALWRLSVNLDRDGGQLKMSKVEFLK